jgi:outer membrane protein assembly factor BamE (lipoprotein component of BamABCDE complex)
MKKIMRFVSAVVLVLLMTACASGSGRINWDHARQVKPGMTQQEVAALMGKPYMVMAKGSGVQTHAWISASAFEGSSTMSVTFKNGIATDVPEIPDSF